MKPTVKNIRYLLHESNLIEGFSSKRADACLLEAWYFLDAQPHLSLGAICRAQKLATLHQKEMRPDWRGYFRHISGQRVWIAGREGTPPALVPVRMQEWFESLGTRTPRESHIEFEKIHPFVDGNGRTGRLVLWWQEKRNGEPLSVITYDGRSDYYKWFKEND